MFLNRSGRIDLTATLAIMAVAAGVVTPSTGLHAATQSVQPTQISASHAQSAGEELHLVVGRSLFLDTQTRLRRVYVGNPSVLDSTTDA